MVGYSSKIALFWTAFCCVLLETRVAGAHVPEKKQLIEEAPFQEQSIIDVPGHVQGQGDKDVVALDARGFAEPKLVTKREAPTRNCPLVESPAGAGLHKVNEINLLEYTFFIKPQPGFRALVFHMKIDNLWNSRGPYLTDEKIVFSDSDLGSDDINSWLEVQVNYYRHIVHLGRDKHGLIVRVGNWSRSIRSSPWWKTHSFEGFVVLVGGSAKLMFDCLPRAVSEQSPVHLLYKPVLLGCVLGGAFVLVVAAWVYLLLTRRGRPHSDVPPPIPKLPESLLLQRGQKSDPDSTYEEFDEDTLLRLRQKLDPDTFACYNTGSADAHCGFKDDDRDDGTKALMPSCDEEVRKLSLLEEKQKAWQENPGEPAPETHYVEMHGIVDTNSRLSH